MKRLLAPALLAVLFSWTAAVAADPLFGKWKVTFTPEDKPGAREFTDTLVFTTEQLYADDLRKQGFEPAAYDSDTRRYGPAKFTATQKSDKAGKLEWSGTAVNQEITGKLTWTKPDGKAVTYDFKGSKLEK